MVATETTYLSEAISRLCEVELDALEGTYSAFRAYTGFFGVSPVEVPYSLHRIGDNIPTDLAEDNSEDYTFEVYTIVARFVLGHATADGGGFKGLRDTDMYTMLPLLLAAYRRHVTLISDFNSGGVDYTGEMAVLSPQALTIPRSTGLMVFQQTGFPVPHVGFEIGVRLPFVITTEQET